MIKVIDEKKLCLAIGAGAIGRSITGCIFTKIGCEVVFADVMQKSIDDINNRHGYVIHVAETGKKTFDDKIEGISAINVNSSDADALANEADYICTSVGPVGIRALLPKFIEWVVKRNETTKKPLCMLFFENDSECETLVKSAIEEKLGCVPDWMSIARTSIERMTKQAIEKDGSFNVLSEQFIPVIAPKSVLEKSGLDAYPEYFMGADSLPKYYYRKLYTNNLGHAVLGYAGTYYGYETVMQALADKRIENLLRQVLKQSSEMLMCEYGFEKQEIDAHVESLMLRYANAEFDDSLERLSRTPTRKLSSHERILGSILHCYEHGKGAGAIIDTLCYAVNYYNAEDPSSVELADLLKNKGIEGVLQSVCGLTPEQKVYQDILLVYQNNTYKNI